MFPQIIKPAGILEANHKFLVSVALGVDRVRVKFEFALGKVLSCYISILLMNTYTQAFGVGGMKGRNGGDTCFFLVVPRLTGRIIVILMRPEMPVIIAAIYWGSVIRSATPWHFEAEAWRAIYSVIGNCRRRR